MTAAAAFLAAVPLSADTAMAQVGVDVRIGPPRAPGYIVETEGRRYRDRDDCRKITITEWRDGVKVKRTKWRCD